MRDNIVRQAKKQIKPAQSITSEPGQGNVVQMPKKKKRYPLTVTFGNTWWKEDDEPGKPQGTHEPGEVESFANLSVLAGVLEARAMSLDDSLPLAVAKTHQPYIVWSGLKETEYRDKHGDLQTGIVRRTPNAMPSRILPFDIDGAHLSAFNALTKWLKAQGFEFIYYRTASDDATRADLPARRFRLILAATDLFPDVKEACLRLEFHMMQGLGATVEKSTWTLPDGSAIKFDRTMSDPAHFAFLPVKGVPVPHVPGAMVDISELPEAGTLSSQNKARTSENCLKGFTPARWPELEAAIHLCREQGTYNGGGELERTEWLKVLSALKHFEGTEFEDKARELWEDVSIDADEAAAKWDSERDKKSQWNAPIFMARDLAPEAFPVVSRAEATDADLDDGQPRKKKKLPKVTDTQLSPADHPALSFEGDFTPKGELIRAYNTANNARAVLYAEGLKLCVNQMNGQLEMHTRSGIVSRPSMIDSVLTSAMSRNKVPESAIRIHCPAIAEETAYHPVVRQLDAKEWDGVDRISEVLDAFNFKQPDYSVPVMRAWLRATVAAAYTERGFSSKLVPVLVGLQNAAKSSAIRRIVDLLPGCFTDQHFSPGNKDSLIHAASHWVQEWGEMDRLTVKDMPAVKAYISSMADSFRRPYARLEESKARQGTIIGTANIGADTGVLKDSSGNVRFAVLETGQIDIERVNKLLGWKWDGVAAQRTQPDDLEQFWLQVKAEWLAGETTSMPAHLVQQQAEINEQYEEANAYDQAIAEYLHQYRDCAKAWKLSRDITEMMGFPPERVRPVGKSLASAVRRGEVERRDAGQRVKEYLWPLKGSIASDKDLKD